LFEKYNVAGDVFWGFAKTGDGMSGKGECPVVDAASIPVYVNNRDRVTTTMALVDWLLSAGTQRIVILDNESTYEPLLDYYNNLPAGVDVKLFGQNCGPWAFWDKGMHLLQTTPYIVSDSDLVPTEDCPKDLVRLLNLLLNERPQSGKVGVGLKIDDVPGDLNEMNGWYRHIEAPYWTNRYNDKAFFAGVDTTFAIYGPASDGRVASGHSHGTNLRTDSPYLFRHMPWYQTLPLSDEEQYYRTHSRKSVDPRVGHAWSHNTLGA
jgi:hypothetical protein